MFLNLNNGYEYTVNQGSTTLSGPGTAFLVEDGTVSFSQTQTGIKDLYQSSISLYPNPSKSSFTIQHALDGESIQLELINQVGQVVLSKELNSTREVIGTTDIPEGIYFVKITNHSEAVGVMKLQIQK